jgi:TPR repeat protein
MRLSRVLLCCTVLICNSAAQSSSDKPTVPPGVNYKFASAEVNAAAAGLLQRVLKGDEAAWKQLFSDNPQTCGPMLWQAIRPGADSALLNAKPLTLVVPGDVAIATEGRALLTDEDRRSFWTALKKKYPALAAAVVRKASAKEINYYWATIPFDIDEPFFAIDIGSDVLIANLKHEDGKITLFWLDVVGDFRTLTPHVPADGMTKTIVDELANQVETRTPQAMYRAGKAYLSGEGVTADVERGRTLLDSAAQNGLLDAQMLLGMAYFGGKYLPQDRAKAAPYLLMAADQGNAMAQFYVGIMYVKGAGLGQSAEKARVYLRKAADQNVAAAQYNLGALYFQGIGIPEDKARACALYVKAADQGHLEATNDLGWCYQQGTGVEKDLTKAMNLYTRAAENGHITSQGNLAMMYVASGEWEKAYLWLRIAENAGGAQARPFIEDAKKHLSPEQIELAESEVTEWMKKHQRQP